MLKFKRISFKMIYFWEWGLWSECYSDMFIIIKNVSHSVSLFSISFYLLFVIIKRRISLSSTFLSAIIVVNIVFICLFFWSAHRRF